MSDDKAPGTLQVRVSQVLRYGVILAGAVICIGVAMLWASGDPGFDMGRDPVAAFAKAPETASTFPRTAAGVAGLVRAGKPGGVIQVGLLLLMVLPVVRVGATVLLFLEERDRTLAAIASLVLILLLYAALGSGLE
jgi:uncharacterized membrane protein